jgi:hypothetical protein
MWRIRSGENMNKILFQLFFLKHAYIQLNRLQCWDHHAAVSFILAPLVNNQFYADTILSTSLWLTGCERKEKTN